MSIANIDKVETNDVVTSMFRARTGFVKAIDVESRCEYGPNG